MAVLIVVIFLLVLLFSVLPEVLPGISRKLVDLTVEQSDEEQRMRQEINELRLQLKVIHMVDEFAKYAKTERKINKLKEELHQICKSKTEVFLKFKLGVNSIYHVLQLVVFLWLIYNYRHETLLQLPSDWFTPINKVIAFPTGVPGVVSVTFWIITCRSSIPRLLRIFLNKAN